MGREPCLDGGAFNPAKVRLGPQFSTGSQFVMKCDIGRASIGFGRAVMREAGSMGGATVRHGAQQNSFG